MVKIIIICQDNKITNQHQCHLVQEILINKALIQQTDRIIHQHKITLSQDRTYLEAQDQQILSPKSCIINKNKEKKKQSIIKMTHLYHRTMRNLIKKTTRAIIAKFFTGSRYNRNDVINLNSISNSNELPHEITTNSPLKILIDSGASSSIMKLRINSYQNLYFHTNSKLNRYTKQRKVRMTLPFLYYVNTVTTHL